MPRKAAVVVETLRKTEKAQILEIKVNRTLEGIDLFMKSPRIHEFIKAKAIGTPILEDRLMTGTGGHKFYKSNEYLEIGISNAMHTDLTRSPAHASHLLKSIELKNGVTFKFSGMIPRESIETVVRNIREAAIKVYKNYIAPYNITITVLANEEF